MAIKDRASTVSTAFNQFKIDRWHGISRSGRSPTRSSKRRAGCRALRQALFCGHIFAALQPRSQQPWPPSPSSPLSRPAPWLPCPSAAPPSTRGPSRSEAEGPPSPPGPTSKPPKRRFVVRCRRHPPGATALDVNLAGATNNATHTSRLPDEAISFRKPGPEPGVGTLLEMDSSGNVFMFTPYPLPRYRDCPCHMPRPAALSARLLLTAF